MWTRIYTGIHILDAFKTVDLDTGKSGDYDISSAGTGNLPGMDLGLSDRAIELNVIRDPIQVALLDTDAAGDPNRCIVPGLPYTYAIHNRNYILVPGREFCVSLDDRRVCLVTIEVGADPAGPSLTFHFTVWQR